MNYIPFGPRTDAPPYPVSIMPLDVADMLVARGLSQITKEENQRFSTLRRTIQREAMPAFIRSPLYQGKGQAPAWSARKGPSFFEDRYNTTFLHIFEKDGRMWFQEKSKNEHYSVMTQAHSFTTVSYDTEE